MEKQKNNGGYNFSVLHDEAVSDDLFEDKTHERLAETLCSLFEKEQKGSTIALEGGWGCGKSVVISILQKKLKERDPDISFFVFDAWAHEGDPLRRVFLESLINKLKDDGRGDSQKLEELAKEITKKKKRVETTTNKTVTKFGQFLTASSLLVPLGAVWMSLIENVNFVWGGKPHWGFIISSLLTGAPIIVILANFFFLIYKKYLTKANINLKDIHNWDFLQSDTTDQISQEISEDEERSSIEFEKYFGKIITELFMSGNTKKIVMVIDNLDRIDSEDALKIWSTLQTFLQQRGGYFLTKPWFKNVWIIVPFDPDGLSKIWKEGKGSVEGKNCSKSFFDKCFQLRLEVPKPILTGWENFSRAMINKALPDWPLEEQEQILYILRLTRENVSDIPSPREIKNYINQVGLLRMHADKKIPIKNLAYYVIYRFIKQNQCAFAQMCDQLLRGSFPIEKHIEFLPGNCREDFSGLFFGVAPHKGQQLLLEPVIAKLLQEGNAESLKDLEEIHGAGFWSVFKQYILKPLLTFDDMLSYSKAIHGGLYGRNPEECNQFILRIDRAIDMVDNVRWPHSSRIESCECLVKLLGNNTNTRKKIHDKLMRAFAQKLQESDKFDFNNELNSLNKLKICFGESIPDPLIYKMTNFDRMVSCAKASIFLNVPAWEWLKPTEEVIKIISEKIVPAGAIPDGISELIDYSIKADIKKSWSDTVTACEKHIFYNHGTFNANTHSPECFKILLMAVLNDEAALGVARNIIKKAEFYNLFYNFRTQILEYAAVLCAYCLDQDINSFTVPSLGNSGPGLSVIKNFWSDYSEDNAKKVISILKRHDKWDVLWKLLKNKTNRLAGDIIGMAIDDKDAEKLFRTGNVLQKIKLYREAITDDKETEKEVSALLEKFIEHSNMEEEILNNEDIDVHEFDLELFLLVSKTKNKAVLGKIYNELAVMEKDAWGQSFEDDTYLTALALALRKEIPDFSLKNAYFDALIEFIKEKSEKGDEPTRRQIDNWDKLLSLLESDFLMHYKTKITEHILEKEFDVNEEFYSINTPYILASDIIKRKDVVQKCTENFIDSQDFCRIGWLNSILSQNGKAKFSPDKYFTNVIRGKFKNLYLQSEDEEKKNLLKQYAKYFKIDLYKVAQDEEIDDVKQ